MSTDVENASHDAATPQLLSRGGTFAFMAGLGAALAAGGALWAREGSEVFLTQAFAALAACF